jgi:hypothetical protein
MSESNAGSATTQESSGSTENQSNDKVSYETYKRVLSEAKKFKDLAKQLEEEKAKGTEAKLTEQNEYKKLADIYKQQLDEKTKILNEQEASIVNGMKYQEFEKHLGGRLKNKDYTTFIEFEKIAIDPETKRIDEESVKGVVSKFVKEHSHLIDFNSGAKLPNKSASTATFGGKSTDEMTPKELEAYIKEQHKLGLLK